MKVASSVGVLATLYTVVLVGLYCFGVMDPCEDTDLDDCGGDTRVCIEGDYFNAFKVLSIYAFAYSVAYNIPAMVNELSNNTNKRLDATIWPSIMGVTGMYIATALFGYFAFGPNVEADLLHVFPKHNVWSVIARVALSLNVMTGFPLQMHPTKNSVSQILFQQEAVLLPRKKYYPLTLVIFLLAWAVAMVITDLSIVLAFVGATTCNLIGYVLPCYFYLKVYDPAKQTFLDKAICWGIIITGTMLIPTLITLEIYTLIYPS